MMPRMRYAWFLGVFVLVLAGCGGRQPPLSVADCTVVRDYGWDTPVADPAAAWHPASYLVLARSAQGFMLLDEGRGNQQVYGTSDKSQVHDLGWWGDRHLVFGPPPGGQKDADGRVLMPANGIRVGQVARGRMVGDLEDLTTTGYQPRPWGRELLMAIEDRLILVDRYGNEEEFEQGFDAVPQPGGKGVAFRTVPLSHTDHWTGLDRPGDLLIRWPGGAVDRIPGGWQARWTAAGGVVCSRHPDVAPGGVSQILHIPGPGVAPQLVTDGQEPAPHPSQPLLAYVDGQGQVVLTDLPGATDKQVITPVGRQPQWSHDGKRLLTVEPIDAESLARHLHVYVLQWQ